MQPSAWMWQVWNFYYIYKNIYLSFDHSRIKTCKTSSYLEHLSILTSLCLENLSISNISLSRTSLYLKHPSISNISLSRTSLYLKDLFISKISLFQTSLCFKQFYISISNIFNQNLDLFSLFLYLFLKGRSKNKDTLTTSCYSYIATPLCQRLYVQPVLLLLVSLRSRVLSVPYLYKTDIPFWYTNNVNTQKQCNIWQKWPNLLDVTNPFFFKDKIHLKILRIKIVIRFSG